jgi:hypothetical protein
MWYPESFFQKIPTGVNKSEKSKLVTNWGFLFGDFFIWGFFSDMVYIEHILIHSYLTSSMVPHQLE